ncbi:uncharacterized protein LOC114916345 [Cajanus cajan]|uniref:uncharacterized protein LOC114916345 n=1 Tax=Cajanus cajan TaxID=3821 RepID=UPI0010FAE297|nr:uncharacterized protein LOC114916345 [Cajanus cajan]
MFLARRRFHPPPKEPPPIPHSESRVRHKLKDLFVSSPPPREGPHEVLPNSSVAVRFRRPAASLRPVSSVFRYRLLRRAWRPVLVTIPE